MFLRISLCLLFTLFISKHNHHFLKRNVLFSIFYWLFFRNTEFFTSVPNLKKSIILYFTALHTLLPHPRLIYYHFSVRTFYNFIVYKCYILTLHFSLIYSSFCMLKDKIWFGDKRCGIERTTASYTHRENKIKQTWRIDTKMSFF